MPEQILKVLRVTSWKAFLKEVEGLNSEVPDIHPMMLLRYGIEELATGKVDDLAKASEDLSHLMDSWRAILATR